MVVLDQLAGAADGIGDRVAVPGQRDLGRELDRPLERLEEVAERVGAARGQRPTVGEIRPSRWSAETRTRSLAGRAARRRGRGGDELPAVEPVAVVDEDRVALEADERPVDVAGADQLLGDLVRDAVVAEPVGDPLRPVRVPPDELALRVVERPLVDGRRVSSGRRRRRRRDPGGSG